MLPLIARMLDPEDRIGALWCSLMHDSPMWPIHGHYQCRVCGRQFRVPWAESNPGTVRPPHHPPLPFAL